MLLLAIAASGSVEAREIANLRAGELAAANVPATEKDLTISGQMNAADFAYILDNLNDLTRLDLSRVTIAAYSGAALPYTGISRSEANKLPDYALTGMTNLTSVILPSTLEAVGKGSLSGTGITSLNIPSAVMSVGDYAAMRCEKLQSVTIPENVTSIGTRAFAYCPELTTVQLTASVNRLPEGLFEACGGLRSLDLSYLASCTEIGPWTLAECNGIESLVLPSTSEAVQAGALFGTSGIETLVLPPSLNYLGDNAMSSMTSLNQLNVSNVNSVPSLGEKVWSNTRQGDVTLITPNDQVQDYRDAAQWQNFKVISLDDWKSSSQDIISSGNENGMTVSVNGPTITVNGGDKELGNIAVFNASGRRVLAAKAGNKIQIDAENWPSGVYLIVSALGAAKVII